MRSLFTLLAFFYIIQKGFTQENIDCSIEVELSLAPEKWVEKDLGARDLINDTICKKSVLIDTCIWKDISHSNFAIKKGFYKFKHIDSTFSMSITLERKMNGYDHLYKEVTGKKFKGNSKPLASDLVYNQLIIETLNQLYEDSTNNDLTEKYTGIYNSESILAFEIRSKEDILIMRIDNFNSSKSIEGTAWFKINSDRNFLMVSLIKGVGKPADIEERQEIEDEISSWFLLKDDFSSSH
ncbi:MAG: hypothetical protein AB8B53_06295 [Flavobacteriales bacterium]